jgi:fibronectin type 3 domain-containing protein
MESRALKIALITALAGLAILAYSYLYAQQTDTVTLQIKVSGYITLNWTRSTSEGSECCTYNVYRGTASGGPYAKLVGDITSNVWQDTSAENGTTYFYTVTAVNTSSDHQESAYSNEASATID